ncbi:NfeD family protein [Cellulosilyticum sp. I15G10I2]|uniref:NfeD family protein n=1 Tax=Cellulosilyticum sp. I15G10I2 TaxID=1892843 RepID=UPI00085BBDD3|nr:NfeD family protein [Cellulosilyticum sp. I15G10I2]
MWILWLIVGIVFSVAEILYSGFFLIWFAIGAFLTIIVSFFTDNILYQSVIFLVISIILLLTLTKHFAKKFASGHTFPTNIDSLIGKKGIVIQNVGKDSFESGLVKLDGEIWTAVSQDGNAIEKGAVVQIHEIKGVRLIVSEAQN